MDMDSVTARLTRVATKRTCHLTPRGRCSAVEQLASDRADDRFCRRGSQ